MLLRSCSSESSARRLVTGQTPASVLLDLPPPPHYAKDCFSLCFSQTMTEHNRDAGAGPYLPKTFLHSTGIFFNSVSVYLACLRLLLPNPSFISLSLQRSQSCMIVWCWILTACFWLIFPLSFTVKSGSTITGKDNLPWSTGGSSAAFTQWRPGEIL